MTHKVTADIIQRRGLFSLYIRIHYRSHDSRVMTNDQKIKIKTKTKQQHVVIPKDYHGTDQHERKVFKNNPQVRIKNIQMP